MCLLGLLMRTSIGTEAALRITAAYIDLNPVRAKVVDDPKEYRWSGYGEAMGARRWLARGSVRVSGGRRVGR